MNNIWIAASDGRLDTVKEYISKGQSANDADPNGYTPIHAAASYGHVELLKYLIQEAGGDINITDADGDTPLHTVESAKVARFMIEELGADSKIKNDEGQTALQKIEEEDEFPEVLEYLKSLEVQNILKSKDSYSVEASVLPDTTSVRYTYQKSTEDDEPEGQPLVDPEQRKRLEEIMTTNENDREENLRAFVHEMIQGRFEPSEDDQTKRRKEE